MQIDMLTSRGIDGRLAQDVLDEVGLSANCNSIANDPLPPYRPSGLRLGTPAMTTRGLVEDDMAIIAEWINKAIEYRDKPAKLAALKKEVKAFALKYPLPNEK
jgi:glycine hydroxymethyltransferase